jgi:hypothetical protein
MNILEAQTIISVLRESGPQTGGELLGKTGMDPLPLWQCCRRTPAIVCQCVGKRYVRLDRNVQGYARLSPSIRREFLTYTVIGLEEQRPAIEAKAQFLREETHRITCAKMEVAREAMKSVVQSLAEWPSMEDRVCFLIAGDIVYDMGHAVPRPEISTGKMVRGSDLDIIVVAEDDVPKSMLKALDAAILKKKYYLLVHPNYQEEIDYLVKDFSRVREQLVFDSFQHMIAGKILHESEFLFGSALVFEKIKRMVGEFKVSQKLASLEKIAEEDRQQAENSLLQSDAERVDASMLHLFYTREEGDEIY